VALLLFAMGQTPAAESLVYPGSQWVKATTAQKAGWSSAGLKKAREYSDSIHSSSVMIIQESSMNGVTLLRKSVLIRSARA
jgi:hypothetical protein